MMPLKIKGSLGWLSILMVVSKLDALEECRGFWYVKQVTRRNRVNFAMLLSFNKVQYKSLAKTKS